MPGAGGGGGSWLPASAGAGAGSGGAPTLPGRRFQGCPLVLVAGVVRVAVRAAVSAAPAPGVAECLVVWAVR